MHLHIHLKGCVLSIFSSLFLSLNESTYQTMKNVFYFRSRENQKLEFCIFKFHYVIKCMVKLDIASVEILTNIICFPLAYVFRKNICAYFRTRCFRKPFMKYMFLKIERNHMKTSEPESLFHKVAGLQPTVLLKKTLNQVFSCELS